MGRSTLTDIIQFVPRRNLAAQENLADFIRACRDELKVFGADLDWPANAWPQVGVTFGNLDQATRKLDPAKVLRQPFLDFAKAYFRYQQGHKPTKALMEISALRCTERALIERCGGADLQDLDAAVLDRAAVIAREHNSAGRAYHVGRELARLASFVSEKHLIPAWLDWKNPISRPTDTVRTGKKAREEREKKLPSSEALDALAEIFAKDPAEPKDVFTTSASAMLLSASSRASEVLALPEDCEVWETKRDGTKAYGWRFQPGKGAAPMIKWIPDAMASTAQEAIRRIRGISEEARRIAIWLETQPDRFYRHARCPDVPEDVPLTVFQAANALGINSSDEQTCRSELRRYGLSGRTGGNSLASLNCWVHTRLPNDFPWFDKDRGLRYSEALFTFQERQLRTDMAPSPFMIWRPTTNALNSDLGPHEASDGYIRPTIFDRYGYNVGRAHPVKVTTHQFRHLLDTMAQRGGLSQAEIARWAGRKEVKQNRVYDHMTEFELVDMLRNHDPDLTLDRPLAEIAEQIASQIPMTRQEFNTLTIPTAHVTEYGFCVHDFVMSPCQRFRDCLNCTEQNCIKGDRRLDRIKVRYAQVKRLKEQAEREIANGSAGADRWYEIHALTERRLKALIAILEDPSIPNGAIVRLRNEHEFSPLRRAVEAKAGAGKLSVDQQPLLDGLRGLIGKSDG